jgi:hypothetical protein
MGFLGPVWHCSESSKTVEFRTMRPYYSVRSEAPVAAPVASSSPFRSIRADAASDDLRKRGDAQPQKSLGRCLRTPLPYFDLMALTNRCMAQTRANKVAQRPVSSFIAFPSMGSTSFRMRLLNPGSNQLNSEAFRTDANRCEWNRLMCISERRQDQR